MKLRQQALMGLIFALLMVSPAQAVPVLWTLNNAVFDDGGAITGSFIYDADTDTFSSINVTTTAGTDFGGFAYGDANFDLGSNTFLVLESPDWLTAVNGSRLDLVFFDFLTNAGGTIDLDLFGFTVEGWCVNVPDCIGSGDRDVREAISGSVTGAVVPVPAALWLLSSALGLLSWMRRRPA